MRKVRKRTVSGNESERERGWEVSLEKKRREYFESGGEESV